MMYYVSDCMRTQVYTVRAGATLGEAMRIMGSHMVGTIPVVDADHHLVGMVVMDDLLTQFMPRFVQLLRTTDFVHDYGKFELGAHAAELVDKPVEEIMRPPYSLREDSGLMEAMVFMHNHQASDVPVVDADKRIVGIVSRVRVGSLFLVGWLNQTNE